MKGWLDNYNDFKVSAPEGWVGDGYSNVGRNYSPAWGGQFAMGGSVPGAVGFMYARTNDPAPSEGPYTKKTKASAQDGKSIQKKRYNDLYAPIEEKVLGAVGTSDNYNRLPYSTKQFLENTIAGFSAASNRNIPPMDPIIKEVQNKVINLPKEEINKLLNTNWSKIGIPGAMKNTPSSVSYLDMLKYINHFNKLKKEGYTLQDGGDIPNEIFLRQAYRESLFNPKAKSGKGAKGLVQLKPEAILDYARANKVDVKSIDPYNVADAMKVQDWFMNHYIDSDLVTKYAKTPEDKIGITLGIYNYGYGNMRSNLRENKGYNISKLPKETRNYINQIQLGKDQQFEQDYQTALKNNPHIQKLYIPEEITPIIPDVETPGWLDNMITTGKGVYKAAKETLGKFPVMFEDGGVIEDDLGQWAHPGKITKIGSNQITMRDVPYPVLGISDTGDTKMMYPEQDYTFIGDSVTEIPMAKNGSELTKLDQLTNFTNYNTKQPGGWLDKYEG